MNYISAPWRAKYVKNVSKQEKCIFCDKIKLNNDRKAFILYRGKYNFIILNKYPYTPGHLMVAPFKHSSSFEKTEKKSTHEMMDLIKMSIKILKQHYNPQGLNSGMNLGKSAGAGIADHYHMHIIPRWTGDSNFMPLIGKAKIFIETLDQTYEQLLPLFEKEK